MKNPRSSTPQQMQVLMMPIENIIPYEGNPRRNDNAIPKVARLIKEFGWQQPIVVDRRNVVIVGHTRLMAGRLLGHRAVPVVVAAHLTPKQAKAYRLADNRSGEEAKWMPELLAAEIEDLRGASYDLELTSFEPGELSKLRLDDDDHVAAPKVRKLSDSLRFQVVVDCENEKDQAALMEKLKTENRKCRPITL
jgi:ParB-like chromosome segregation protein Spo0J